VLGRRKSEFFALVVREQGVKLLFVLLLIGVIEFANRCKQY